MSVIYIFWLRQLKRFIRSRSRIVGALGQPLLFLLALGFGFGPVFEKAGQGNYIQFLTPGIIGMTCLFTAVFSGMEIIWDRQFGFLKETMVAPVSRFQIMFGRTLGGASVATIQGIIVFLLSFIAGFRVPFSLDLVQAFLFLFMMSFLFTAVGTAIASKLSDFQGFQLIMNFIVMPLFFLSGSLFPVSGLNNTIETLIKINPVSYGIDGLRHSLGNTNHFALYNDYAVLIILCLVLLGIGSYLFSKIEA